MIKRKRYKYSEEELFEIIKNFKTKKEIEDKYPHILAQARKLGITDTVCAHMKCLRYNNRTIDEYKKVAKQCNSLLEFRTLNSSLCHYGFLRGWQEQIKHYFKEIVEINSPGELSLRNFLEKIFGMKFTKVNPKWLKNPESGRSLQLDGYSEQLKIAFEHQGTQHYDVNHFRHDSKIKERDSIKRKLCKRNNVKLIIIPDIIHILKYDEQKIKKIILKEFSRLKIKIPPKFYTTKFELIVQHKKRIYSKKDILKIARSYKTQKDFMTKEHPLYKKLVRSQCWDEVSQKIWNIAKLKKTKWTIQLLQEKSIKYDKRSQLKKNDTAAYRAAIKMGVLDQICKHMKPSFHWNKNIVFKKAKLYNNKKEFIEQALDYYTWLDQRDLVKDACAHMS